VLRVLAALIGVVTLAGCSWFDGRSAGSEPSIQRGGVLRVVLSGEPTHLDPQQLYSASELNISRLINRTLTAVRAEPGKAGTEIVPDLATDTGRASEQNRVWEFTLRPKLRWEDGSPITCAHVKYGVERSFSQLFADGGKYPARYLEGAVEYEGPFVAGNNNGLGLRSIECVDSATIRFRLRQPVGDFGHTVATPVFAPVPPERDTKDGYDRRPFANGPYKIEEYTRERLVLVRNGAWDRGGDKVRRAHPDQIVFTWSADGPTVTNRLIESQGDWADTIALDSDIAAAFVQQVINDPTLDRRAIRGPTGGIRYFAINTRTVRREECRKVLVYGFNKRRYQAVLGGSLYGDLATTTLNPQLQAHRDFDLYGSRAAPDGSPERAQRLIQQAAAAGQPCPTRVRVGYPDTVDVQRQIASVAEAYQRIGIEVVRAPHPPTGYYTTYVGHPDHGVDLVYAGWVPDWASGSAVIPPLFDGRQLADAARSRSGSTNFSNLDNPEINALIDRALAEPDARRQYALWGELDEKTQALAATIPVLYPKALRMTGVNVRGGFIHPQFGQPDLAALGLAGAPGARG
jgi:peptide/nickel transport system substrate-binding protein